MKKHIFLAPLIIILFLSYQSSAQGRAASPAQITIEYAEKLVKEAIISAKEANANVAVSIIDANGDLVYFHRMDGAMSMAVTSAQGKARAAILFGQSTKSVADAVKDNKAISSTLNPSGAGSFAITIQQGGLPIVKDGKIIGGIGIGGSSPTNDELFAKAALEKTK
ncbi:GlcG/HbpS family heme-binding protein [Pedobacter psychroterrae]|uniref:Heme-binding protein n=1 Tax=Pedobacter psychroterrae TaxID=2530453 RepID=A0A4R0NSV5_9SPHI|nr:heme-binding protein [Pedobacter psychroterrae]TCD03178.1 hypothetical protein EZ437_04180 [Pedobacter psychroterrae]